MISPERLDILQIYWGRMLLPLVAEAEVVYAVFDRLIAAYSEPHRHYHNLEHLTEMFKVAGRLPSDNRLALTLAIWFHDVVYDPQRNDNEDRSAECAAAWLGELGLAPELVARVAELVRSTAHLSHQATLMDTEADALHDADLAILGASERRYQRYTADIRHEYSHVADADYRSGRGRVLQAFLALPRIYRTALLQAEGEQSARTNLQREWEALQALAS